jgi:catechol 2,3-dioxygenase-like lactoylglutathione lyase family enzyme
MIGYVTVGTNDVARAAKFYDEVLGVIGAKRLRNSDSFVAWGPQRGSPMMSIIKPFDGKPATVGNGVMVAIAVDTEAQVKAMHAKAMALGMRDEGAPGSRGENFYGAYFRDPDGNKLCAFVKSYLMT